MTKAQKSSVATSPRKQSVQISKQNLDTINHTQDGTTTSSQKLKPQLKITRNNLGTAVFVFFGIFFDLYMLGYSYYYTNMYGAFKTQKFLGPQKYILFAAFIAFVSSIFSIVFAFTVLCVSSLTMQKQKRLKLLPYLVFAVFKLSLHFYEGSYWASACLLIKDILLYSCMSHTAKNQIVRRFFKPYKQVVYYA